MELEAPVLPQLPEIDPVLADEVDVGIVERLLFEVAVDELDRVQLGSAADCGLAECLDLRRLEVEILEKHIICEVA